MQNPLTKEEYDAIALLTWKGLEVGRLGRELRDLEELERVKSKAAEPVRDTINYWKNIKKNTFKKILLIEKFFLQKK